MWSTTVFQIVEISFNSTGVLIGSWLFCIRFFSYLVSFWCMLRVGVEVWAKNVLYRSIEGQTHFVMPRVKWVWPPTYQYRTFFAQNLHINSKHALKTYRIWKDLYAKQPTPTKKSGDLVFSTQILCLMMEHSWVWHKLCFKFKNSQMLSVDCGIHIKHSNMFCSCFGWEWIIVIERVVQMNVE